MGIYVHIPFCRSKCYYCGFYSVASVRLKEKYIHALKREIEIRKDYLGTDKARTLYFGGGTPSFLMLNELQSMLEELDRNGWLSEVSEQTIEVNPEDISPENLRGWRQLGFNRLSIGIQSFNDRVLKQINRGHTARQALEGVRMAADKGFDNIGIDLIIGLPGYTDSDLEKDLKLIGDLPLSHLSVYILSIDSNTVLEKLSQKGVFSPWDDDILADRYLLVAGYLKNLGFEHYEISNFAKDGKYSAHNTAYWQGKKYIGLGAAAHSYDLFSRQWNVAHLKSYIDSLDQHRLNFEKEILTGMDRYNEYLMTGLRTMWGVSSRKLEEEYGIFWKEAAGKVEESIAGGSMIRQGENLRLTERGWLVSDAIFSELFAV